MFFDDFKEGGAFYIPPEETTEEAEEEATGEATDEAAEEATGEDPTEELDQAGPVGKKLGDLGYDEESLFCLAVHHWLAAHDQRGISAEDRMIKMMLVYRYLVKKVAVTFPPPTSLTSCGFNVHLAEDILCGIQARLCLYLMTPETGFAARALSSIDVENMHSILNHLDRRGVQTSTIAEICHHVATLQKLHILRRTPVGRNMYRGKSTIYREPEVGDELSECLTSSSFDLSLPSKKRRLDKPRSRNDAVKGQPRVRQLGHHKAGDYAFQKL